MNCDRFREWCRVWDRSLTSTVHLTEVWKTPNISKSDCVRYTCQHKFSGASPVWPCIFVHICSLTMCPVLWSTLIRVRRGVTPCVRQRLINSLSVRWSVPGGGSSDTQVIRPSYKITAPPKRVCVLKGFFCFVFLRHVGLVHIMFKQL